MEQKNTHHSHGQFENGEPFKAKKPIKKHIANGEEISVQKFLLLVFNVLDNPFVSNKWADLYQYIPLSNTTDKKGAERILDVQFKPAVNTTKIANEKYNEAGKKNAPLYFAHTEEVKESSELLNKTYLPQGYKSEKVPETTEALPKINGLDCSAVNVRTNKGDNLFPGDREDGEIERMETQKKW